MSPQRPGIRHTNQARKLLNIDFDAREVATEFDLQAATAFALLGIAEALGDIALNLRGRAGPIRVNSTTGGE